MSAWHGSLPCLKPAEYNTNLRVSTLADYIDVPITRGLNRIGKDPQGRVYGNLPAPVGDAYFAPSVTLSKLSAASARDYRIVCPRGTQDGNEITLFECELK